MSQGFRLVGRLGKHGVAIRMRLQQKFECLCCAAGNLCTHFQTGPFTSFHKHYACNGSIHCQAMPGDNITNLMDNDQRNYRFRCLGVLFLQLRDHIVKRADPDAITIC